MKFELTNIYSKGGACAGLRLSSHELAFDRFLITENRGSIYSTGLSNNTDVMIKVVMQIKRSRLFYSFRRFFIVLNYGFIMNGE